MTQIIITTSDAVEHTVKKEISYEELLNELKTKKETTNFYEISSKKSINIDHIISIQIKARYQSKPVIHGVKGK